MIVILLFVVLSVVIILVVVVIWGQVYFLLCLCCIVCQDIDEEVCKVVDLIVESVEEVVKWGINEGVCNLFMWEMLEEISCSLVCFSIELVGECIGCFFGKKDRD